MPATGALNHSTGVQYSSTETFPDSNPSTSALDLALRLRRHELLGRASLPLAILPVGSVVECVARGWLSVREDRGITVASITAFGRDAAFYHDEGQALEALSTEAAE